MQPKVKKIHDLFEHWHIKQPFFENYPLFCPQNRISVYYKKRYHSLTSQFKEYSAQLQQIKYFMYGKKLTLRLFNLEKFQENINHPEAFFSLLQKNHVTSKIINTEEKTMSLDRTITKYNNFGRLLCCNSKLIEQTKFLYELANTFFFFAFDQKTFPLFKEFITHEKYHPLARFIYSVVWRNLASKGWFTWHSETIEQLRLLSNQKKEIIYCAGGTDIFHLLRQGIYTIRIIDPFIPTQKKFYANTWRYFLYGTIGDQIICPFESGELVLKKMSVEKHNDFVLGDKKINSSTTTWHVFQKNSLQSCGTIIFEKRTLKQEDFDYSLKKVLLISLNELYFITKPKNNWGIKLYNLPKNFQIFVKQLKHPLDKQTLLNMRQADSVETVEFIQLGSNID